MAGGSLQHHCHHSATPGQTEHHPPVPAGRVLHLPKTGNGGSASQAWNKRNSAVGVEGVGPTHDPSSLEVPPNLTYARPAKIHGGWQRNAKLYRCELSPKSGTSLLTPKKQQPHIQHHLGCVRTIDRADSKGRTPSQQACHHLLRRRSSIASRSTWRYFQGKSLRMVPTQSY